MGVEWKWIFIVYTGRDDLVLTTDFECVANCHSGMTNSIGSYGKPYYACFDCLHVSHIQSCCTVQIN